MLGNEDIKYIENNFYVYDQNWRMYQNYLGEPFLIEDCLVYYDGRILYICAFALSKNKCVNVLDIVNAFFQRIPDAKIDLIDVWGNSVFIDDFLDYNRKAVILDHTPRNSLCFDSIVDINNFTLTNQKKARLAYNASVNKNIQYRILKLNNLSYQHINLMQNFVKTHDIVGPHTTIFLSISNLIRDSNAYVVESYKSDKLLGFAVLMIASKNNAVYCLACYDNTTRAADSTMYGCVEFCKSHNISYLHLGYSASESLLKFKNKWGGKSSGLDYEEYFILLSYNKKIENSVLIGKFLWSERILLDSIINKTGDKNEEKE